MILASNPDRAVTVRERDPTYPGNDVPGGPRGALVDEVNGDSICDQIPLPHGHGSVNFRFSMIPSSLKFQLTVLLLQSALPSPPAGAPLDATVLQWPDWFHRSSGGVWQLRHSREWKLGPSAGVSIVGLGPPTSGCLET